MIKEFAISTHKRNEMLEITGSVSDFAGKIGEGLVTVFVRHTTAGVTINENADPSVQKDILRKLSEIVPESGGYSHAEGNSDAHIKASLVGSSVTVPVKDGKLLLGTWQGIFFCEFDGPRQRKFAVSAHGTK